jgi:hypothetical protein
MRWPDPWLERREDRTLLTFQRAPSPLDVLFLPDGLQAGDRGGRQPRSVGSQEGLREVARADPLEVQTGDQLLQALGPAQVGRQDRRGEFLPLLGRPAVEDARLLDHDATDASEECELGEVAVSHDLLAARPVLEAGVLLGLGGHLGLDGLGEYLAGAVPKDLGEDVLGGRDWPGGHRGCSSIHGGGLLDLVGHVVNV